MGRGDWNDHMDGGWWWIPMMIMMIVVVAGLVRLGTALIRHGNSTSHLAAHAPGAPVCVASPRPTPQETSESVWLAARSNPRITTSGLRR